MSLFTVHPLLVYSQHDILPGHVTPLMWDLREFPDTAHHISNPDAPLTFAHLAEDATIPSLDSLTITCGVFPADWPIVVDRPEGINVGDVLEAIHGAINRRISHEEWERLSPKEQEKIRVVFEDRCAREIDPQGARANGVLRVDCLLQHTSFAGLSVSLEADKTCILTLRRAR